MPPVRDALARTFTEPAFWRDAKETARAWLAFVQVLSEVVLLVTVGGAIYAAWMIKWIGERAKNQSVATVKAGLDWKVDLEETMKDQAQRYMAMSASQRDDPATVRTFLGLAYSLAVNATRNVPRLYRHLILWALITHYPGGLYGLFAYCLAVVVLAMKVGRLFLESPVYR
jgi:hypothetical protein